MLILFLVQDWNWYSNTVLFFFISSSGLATSLLSLLIGLTGKDSVGLAKY